MIHDLIDKLIYVLPILMFGCGLALIIKVRGRLAGVIGLVGFGMIGFQSVAFQAINRGWIEIDFMYELYPYLGAVGLLGWVLVLVAMILIRTKPAEAADYEHYEQSYPSYPEDTGPSGPPPIPYRSTAPLPKPGWGLVTGWIICSVISFIGGFAALAVMIDSGSHMNDSELAVFLAVLAVALLPTIPGAICYLVWLYQAWSSVPEPYRSASPGQAVGFLFIPFYNLYWVFRAVPGLSASIRRAEEAEHRGRAGGAGYGVGVAACVIGIIPYVGAIAWPFFLIWVILANSARNRLLVSLQR
jgi:Domain of unknown function (DUF4328)